MSRLLCLTELLRRIARSPHSLQRLGDVEDDLQLGRVAAGIQRAGGLLPREAGRDQGGKIQPPLRAETDRQVAVAGPGGTRAEDGEFLEIPQIGRASCRE